MTVYQRVSSDCAVWRQRYRGKGEIDWTCAEEGWWIKWIKDAESGHTRQEEKIKTTKKTHGKKT